VELVETSAQALEADVDVKPTAALASKLSEDAKARHKAPADCHPDESNDTPHRLCKRRCEPLSPSTLCRRHTSDGRTCWLRYKRKCWRRR